MLLVLCLALSVPAAVVFGVDLTPAGTVAADPSQLPQVVFPLPVAAQDPRRHLSLQQQTQILTDVQQHHRFQQPLLYSQQLEFGGEPEKQAAAQVGTDKPFLYTQQSQFASQNHNPRKSQPGDTEPLPVPQSQFISLSTAFGSRQPQPVSTTTEKTTPEPSRRSPQDQLRSLRRRPPLETQAKAAEPTEKPEQRPRARLEDSERQEVLADQLHLQNERQKLFQQLKEYNQQQKILSAQREKIVAAQSQKNEGQQESRPVPQVQSPSHDNPLKAQQSQVNPLRQQQQQQQLQAQLQKQFQQQFLQRQELIRKLKAALSNVPASTSNDQVVPNPTAASTTNNSSAVFLANGQKIQITQSPKDLASLPLLENQSTLQEQSIVVRSTPATPTTTTTPRPPKVIFEELTKGVLPPGADFEVIRHKQDGGLEEVEKLPQNLPDKKVTFVFLEEQPDGTVKVQGVRGNTDKQSSDDKDNPVDVDSIIKKIQQGDLKLPPSTKLSGSSYIPTGIPALETTPQESVLAPTYISRSSVQSIPPTQRPNTVVSSSQKPQFTQFAQASKETAPQFVNFQKASDMEFFSSVTISPQSDFSTTQYPFIPVDPNVAVKKFTPSPTDPTPTLLNSPYSVDVQASQQNSETLLIPASSSQPPLSSVNQFTVPSYSSISNQNHASQIHVAAPPLNAATSGPAPQYSTQKPVTNLPRNIFSPTPNSVTTYSPVQYSQTPSFSQYPVYPSSTPAPVSKPQRTGFIPTAPSPSVGASSSVVTGSIYQSNEAHGTPTPRSVLQNEVGKNVVFPNTPDYRFSTNSTKASHIKTPLSAPASGKHGLSQVLKKDGLFAMSKFLKESGLDNILNDTGPYTVFVPTDKAFRALLIQLGGPDKAEEKFRENPRLLSGLLLHHVIPGAFKLDSLQDEMTGVSLAGTQLRVNTYNTQDVEWNDVQVTTINGARVQRDQHDIAIPQGVAHAVDRVMFPLPVGDVVQTLQADRERRFTKFLRVVQASGLVDTLTGTRTFTVFAPTDRAFTQLSTTEQLRAQSEREPARALVQRHVAPGTLFSAGMRYYQVRPSLDTGHAITLLKNSGQLKANNAHVIAHNIPATNGVIHVLDTLL